MKIIGGDTETFKGEPISFQFFSKDFSCNEMIFTSGEKSFRDFIKFLDTLPQNDSTFVIYCHNLLFDMISFFYSKQDELLKERFDFTWGRWKIKGLYKDNSFAVFTHKNKHKVVYLVDTSAFFMGSLANLAKIFCPATPKLDSPKGLGSKRFNPSNKKFVSYAMRDAEICYEIGLKIHSMHELHDIRQCISAPQMASRVFKKRFVEKSMPLPPRKIVYSALHSYHGGKNNLAVKPGLYEGVTVLDIVSAYPFAMTQLPSFTNPSLYYGVKGYPGNELLNPVGVYRVSGFAKPCRYPVLFDHAFKPIDGGFENVWTTGYELNEGLQSGELTIDELFGYCYDYEEDKEPSALERYSRHFFQAKDTAENPVERYFNKILLNSCYGKFIQKNTLTKDYELVFDLDNGKLSQGGADFEAGGLFNPFIATLITGKVRAVIHGLEHRYQSLHTSTDSIMTQRKRYSVGKGLGDLKVEFQGSVLILRNKLYIAYSDSPLEGKKEIPSILYPKKFIVKYALHGFHASVQELERLVKTGEREYDYIKVNKLRESHRRGLTVNHFEKRTSKLNIQKGVIQ